MNKSFADAFRLGMFVAVGAALTGCASIVSGSRQDVTFNSNPDGATVVVAGRTIGKTPITTSLERKSGQALTFSKDGYKPVNMQLETSMNGWFWGNIVFGGFIGSTTDGLSGAVNQYSPSQYFVTLQPEGTGSMETNTATSSNQKAEQYIVVAYKNIIEELNTAAGPYLSSLFDLLKIAPADRSEATTKIKALSEAYTSIPDFADHVVDLYVKGQASSDIQPPPIETDVPQVLWGKIAPTDQVKVHTKAGETLVGTVDSFDGNYMWLTLSTGGRKSLAKSEIERLAIVK